jgi:hypothetical protein
VSYRHSQDRVFRLYAEGAAITERGPLRHYLKLGGQPGDPRRPIIDRAVVVVLPEIVLPGEIRGRHRRLECHIDLCRNRSGGDCPAMADGLCVGGTWTGR